MDATIVGSIVGALIDALAAIVVAVINSSTQHKRFLDEMKEQNKLYMYRVEQLENKVDKHNHFDGRLIALEEQVKTLFNKAG